MWYYIDMIKQGREKMTYSIKELRAKSIKELEGIAGQQTSHKNPLVIQRDNLIQIIERKNILNEGV